MATPSNIIIILSITFSQVPAGEGMVTPLSYTVVVKSARITASSPRHNIIPLSERKFCKSQIR
jgi:hypothetical protein